MVIALGSVRIELNTPPQRFHCLVALALAIENGAQVDVDGSPPRLELKHLLEVVDRAFELFLHERNSPQTIESVRAIGLLSQCLDVELPGLLVVGMHNRLPRSFAEVLDGLDGHGAPPPLNGRRGDSSATTGRPETENGELRIVNSRSRFSVHTASRESAD